MISYRPASFDRLGPIEDEIVRVLGREPDEESLEAGRRVLRWGATVGLRRVSELCDCLGQPYNIRHEGIDSAAFRDALEVAIDRS
ncbi:MAG: hypothetical protein SangKO_076060 [Sandaracinaceae bacterium]